MPLPLPVPYLREEATALPDIGYAHAFQIEEREKKSLNVFQKVALQMREHVFASRPRLYANSTGFVAHE